MGGFTSTVVDHHLCFINHVLEREFAGSGAGHGNGIGNGSGTGGTGSGNGTGTGDGNYRGMKINTEVATIIAIDASASMKRSSRQVERELSKFKLQVRETVYTAGELSDKLIDALRTVKSPLNLEPIQVIWITDLAYGDENPSNLEAFQTLNPNITISIISTSNEPTPALLKAIHAGGGDIVLRK